MSRAPQGIPQWPVVAPDGSSAGFVRMPPYGAASNGDEGLYWGRIGETPLRLSELVPSAAPALDREGRRLAVAFVEEEITTIEIFSVLGDGAPSVRLGTIAGSAQQVAWHADGEAVLAVVAEPGSDSASLTSGTRQERSDADPFVTSRERGQRVWQLDIEGQGVWPVTSSELSVWEIAPFDPDFTICVCSSASGEAAWYSAWIGRLDHASGSIEELYRPSWQVMGLAADPVSGRVAFVEGWASDRGLVAGEVVILTGDGLVQHRLANLGADVTYVEFDGRGHLHFAGWKDLGTSFGTVSFDESGGLVQRQRATYVAACLMNSPWRPSLAVSQDGETIVTCRSDERTPRQVAVLRSGGRIESWVEGSGEVPSGLSVEEVSWQGPRATDIHGLFLQSDASRSDSGHAHAGSLVLLIHGGPSLAHHHSFDLHHANRLLEAGYCVLLANQRGGPGRGSEFAMANHGDPGGAELEDVLSGADFLMSSGRVRQQAPAVMGSSYGGYLSALAAVTRPVACAVVGAGMSDLASCRNTCNNAPFYDLLLGGPPSEAIAQRLYVERSAVYRCSGAVAPTLILHGANDSCVPVAQAHELYGALTAAGAEVEMVIYPREGHQITEPAHVADYWSRVLGWLSSHCAIDR
ncbi:MAG: prolyl oligopeptidase family serine peptidase [Acidimicrobiales bacterium]